MSADYRKTTPNGNVIRAEDNGGSLIGLFIQAGNYIRHLGVNRNEVAAVIDVLKKVCTAENPCFDTACRFCNGGPGGAG